MTTKNVNAEPELNPKIQITMKYCDYIKKPYIQTCYNI